MTRPSRHHVSTGLALVLALAAATPAVAQQPRDRDDGASELIEQVGEVEGSGTARDWDEFRERPDDPVYTFGRSQLANVRAWIGHSDCRACPIGENQTQRFKVDGLTPDRVYRLTIRFGAVSTKRPFTARISEGDIVRGEVYESARTGRLDRSDPAWTIVFRPRSRQAVIEIGNDARRGNEYAYFDAISLWGPPGSAAAMRGGDRPGGKLGASSERAGGERRGDGARQQRLAVPLPAAPMRLLTSAGANDFTQAYFTQSLVYHLLSTGDAKWAEQFVRWTNRALEERDASGEGGRSFGWTDRSENMLRPFVWGGFVGHTFTPIMHFARVVLSNRELGRQVVDGQPLEAYARRYMDEFRFALAKFEGELDVTSDGLVFYRLPKDIPVRNARAANSPYPVNLNAVMFNALLHYSCAADAIGDQQEARRSARLVRGFARYLDQSVLERVVIDGRPGVVWNYSTYIVRRDDVGHANVVVRFLVDAEEAGLRWRDNMLDRAANTFDTLMSADGRIEPELIDGTNFSQGRARLARSIYHVILLARYSPSLKAKVDRVMAENRNFAYQGAWLMADGDVALTDRCRLPRL